MCGWNIDPSYMLIDSATKSKPKTPTVIPPRDYLGEIQSQLDASEHFQPQVSEISHRFDMADAMSQGDIYDNYVGPLSRRLSQQANTAQRTADVGDVQNLGPAAVQAILNADPQQKALRDAANQGVMAEYAKGSTYDPIQARQVVQQARASRTSQGFGQGSNNDLLSEAMALGMGGEQLRQQRFQNVQSVMQSNQQQTGDPFMAVLGRPGQSLGFAAQAYGQQQAVKPNQDPSLNQYAQDLNNTNFNASYANLFSQRNQAAADKAALYGLIGNVIGGGSRAAAAI